MKKFLLSVICLFTLTDIASANIWEEVNQQECYTVYIRIPMDTRTGRFESFRASQFLIKDGVIYFIADQTGQKVISSIFTVRYPVNSLF